MVITCGYYFILISFKDDKGDLDAVDIYLKWTGSKKTTRMKLM